FALARVGAATLDHEAFDDAMKRGAVVEFFPGEFLEVLDGFWSDVRPEGESHLTVGSLDDGVFRSRFGSAHKRRSEPRAFGTRKNQNVGWRRLGARHGHSRWGSGLISRFLR